MASNDPVLTVYDTFAAEKRPLELLQPGKCTVYCCGPTVYDMSHIGHARAALLPDVLVRFLRHQDIEVKYARNITDIDDKIIKRANETGVDSKEVSERYAAEYLVDLDAMGLLRPDVAPKVSDHIEEIIELVTQLIDKKMAYAVEGDVYFSVSDFEPYGGLSKRDLDNMRAGARVAVDDRKRAPADFALWKAAKPDEPRWESPWGPGRPGWHIECSAMSSAHLGQTFDIHTGGMDLIFPHHENEIAQSQGACGEGTFARYWIHNGFVNFAGEKMAKSVGNFFTIREVTALYHPEVLRYFLLSAHYRRGVNFDVSVSCPACKKEMTEPAQQACKCQACDAETDSDTLRKRVCFPGLDEADERVAYIYETLLSVSEFVAKGAVEDDGEVDPAIGGMLDAFLAKMRDDLNTAGAYGELSEPLAAVNRLLQSGKGVNKEVRKRSIARFGNAFTEVGEILGCFEREPSAYLEARRDLKAARIGLDTDKVEALVAERREVRAAKNWARADEIRDELDALGVKIRDGDDATLWSL
jgi:cysteinyl-tRNA synthetase